MNRQILGLLAARHGHFRYESGHHGELWLDIPRLYLRPSRLRPFAAQLAERLAALDAEVICGPLVEGALLAAMVAEIMDLEYYNAEQFSRPADDGLFPVGYRLPEAFRPSAQGKAVAVVDDVINAGSATRGALEDLRSCGAKPVGIGALLVWGRSASGLASGWDIPLVSLASLPGTLWEPSSCPLCTSGAPFGDVAGTGNEPASTEDVASSGRSNPAA